MNFWERDENTYKNYNAGGNNAKTASHSSFGNFNDQNYEQHTASANSQDWQEKIGQYAGKSQDELMSELLSTANRMRNAGQLSNADLDSFFNRASAFLNDEQIARMRTLIEMLKR